MKNNMANLFAKNENEWVSSAKVVDGNLILSLPDAINPVVWRMELGSVKASALEVKKNPSDGSFVLMLKTPKGEVHDISPYMDRAAAVTALMRVSTALQSAEGKINPSVSMAAATDRQAFSSSNGPVFIKPDANTAKWLFALGAAILLIFMFAYLSKSSGQIETAGIPSPETATSVTGQPNAESGVAQSADDLLKGN